LQGKPESKVKPRSGPNIGIVNTIGRQILNRKLAVKRVLKTSVRGSVRDRLGPTFFKITLVGRYFLNVGIKLGLSSNNSEHTLLPLDVFFAPIMQAFQREKSTVTFSCFFWTFVTIHTRSMYGSLSVTNVRVNRGIECSFFES